MQRDVALKSEAVGEPGVGSRRRLDGGEEDE